MVVCRWDSDSINSSAMGGVVFCITIVGVPFGMQHFKLMRLAMFPFGKTLV